MTYQNVIVALGFSIVIMGASCAIENQLSTSDYNEKVILGAIHSFNDSDSKSEKLFALSVIKNTEKASYKGAYNSEIELFYNCMYRMTLKSPMQMGYNVIYRSCKNG